MPTITAIANSEVKQSLKNICYDITFEMFMNGCMYLNQEFIFKEFKFENVVEISLNSDNMNKL